MDTPSLPKKYVRTTDRIRSSLKRVVLDLEETLRERGRRRGISEEAVINASWLWMRSMDPAALADQLRPFLDQAEAALLNDEPTPAPGSVAQPVDLTKARKRRAR